jgi:pteridine reductase
MCRDRATRDIDVRVLELHLESERSVLDVCDEILAIGVDGVVHNASEYHTTPLEDLDFSNLDRLLRVNAIAPLVMSSRLAPALRESCLAGGGSIVFLGDIHAMGAPRLGFSGYLASKGAVERVVESLAIELAPKVRVNGIAPGVVAFAEGEMTFEQETAYVSRIPLGRSGTLEEAGRAITWLLLDATYVSGDVIKLCGGRSLT